MHRSRSSATHGRDMNKASIDAAERELQWARESWEAMWATWENEMKEKWSDYLKINDANLSKSINDGASDWQAFVSGPQPAHTLENLNEARRFWSAFLTHANRVFSKLQQGSKIGSSQPWYGGIIRERRTDPLLQYIHQARDADEHGDVLLGQDTVVRHVAPGVRILVTHDAIATGGPPLGSFMDLPVLSLLPVKTRSGTYPPPTSHLGQPIYPSIQVVASATLAYLVQIMAEAKSRMA
jgi:hypothetical protein